MTAVGRPQGVITLAELASAVGRDEVDTVIVAFVDMQGRLVGKHMAGRHFLDAVANSTPSCPYLLAADMELEPDTAYAIASWDTGFGDFLLRPDLSTLRLTPWLRATALVLCDLEWPGGEPVAVAPREILMRQLALAAERGLSPVAACELEYYVFETTYREAWDSAYRRLPATVGYPHDGQILATTYLEPFQVGFAPSWQHTEIGPFMWSRRSARAMPAYRPPGLDVPATDMAVTLIGESAESRAPVT
jgi:glutamine synthetase